MGHGVQAILYRGSAYEVLNIIRTQTGETPAAHQKKSFRRPRGNAYSNARRPCTRDTNERK